MTSPALSVVVVAPNGMASIERTMRHLRSQSARCLMEIIVVAPSAEAIEVGVLGDDFAAVRVVAAGPIQRRGAAAARGIEASTARIVALLEEHSYPEPEWAAALISAHSGPWTAVGPAVENANPASVMSCVNFILAYVAFSGAVPAGERTALPWHNSAYKRDTLAPFGERLGELLEWEADLQDELRAGGHALYLEPAARTHHMNVTRMRASLQLAFQRGRMIGVSRARRQAWPRWRQGVQAAAFPIFPLLQLRHLAPQLRRIGLVAGRTLRIMPGLMLTLVVLAVGEAAG